ncbi:hypothetical protein [Desulfosporosinus fructosivorans]|nr:hypothetical protein [Desulfosporosinus fructosivorans]
MIKVYSNYVVCDTREEAIKAQTIIINAMCHIPKICEERDMFLVHHELGEYKMQALLNPKALATLYKEWRELTAEHEQDGKSIDCGESNVRSDFSAFAELDETISFEEMLILERAY